MISDVPGPATDDDGDKGKKRKHLPDILAPFDDEKPKLALEFYNDINGTNYELAGDFFLSNDFILDGTCCVHCNFAAWQPGKSSPRLFFAELDADDFTKCNWSVMVCIVLEGNTTVGCSSCSEVIHPTHGFRQGNHKVSLHTSKMISDVPGPTKDNDNEAKSTAMEPSDPCRIHAEGALELYNEKHGANYELVDTLVSKDVLLDGSWFHCNFTAKPPNEDIAPKHFFAEIYSGDTFTPISCFILEDGQTTDSCEWCSEVIHPTRGFCSRVCKFSPAVYRPAWYKPKKNPPFKRPTCSPLLSMFRPTLEQLKPPTSYPWEERLKSDKNQVSKRPVVPYTKPTFKVMGPSKYAEDALASYNLKNGTNYEVVDTLISKDLLLDGTWYHINFTAKPRDIGEISLKRFFAEIYFGDAYSPSYCFMLEEGKTTDSCSLCSEVLHPTEGFTCRVRKYPEPNLYPEYKPKCIIDVD